MHRVEEQGTSFVVWYSLTGDICRDCSDGIKWVVKGRDGGTLMTKGWDGSGGIACT